MPDEEQTTQQAEQPGAELDRAEEVIEVQGAGFVPGLPGLFANCRVVLDAATRQVVRVEPLGEYALIPRGMTVTPAKQPASEEQAAQPGAESTDQAQQSNGG
jgi:hypothetical protein